jgi:hypothetical protein
MSTDYDTSIRDAMDKIRKLRTLKKQVDPASGLAVAVRRGVPQDNEDVEHDAESRPWTSMETSVNMQEILDLLIKEQLGSLKFRVSRGAEYAKMLAATVVLGREFLDAEKP